MYKTGPCWVGLDTAEEGCTSSFKGGAARKDGSEQAPQLSVPAHLPKEAVHVPATRTISYSHWYHTCYSELQSINKTIGFTP